VRGRMELPEMEEPADFSGQHVELSFRNKSTPGGMGEQALSLKTRGLQRHSLREKLLVGTYSAGTDEVLDSCRPNAGYIEHNSNGILGSLVIRSLHQLTHPSCWT
jgi:hypothetical protein